MKLPSEEEHVQEVVGFAEEIADDAARVAAADLVGGEQQVDALHHVPHRWRRQRVERPVIISYTVYTLHSLKI